MNVHSGGGHTDAPVKAAPESRPHNRHRFRLGLIIPALILMGLVLWLAFGNKKKAPPTRTPPVAVSVAKVTPTNVPMSVTALGQAQAWQSALVRPQVGGRLLQVPVKEGADIQQGALIAQIDPAPYQAALTVAEGALAKDKASEANAELDLKRYQQLASQDSIAQQQVDTQAALVEQDKGVIKQDEGTVAAAQVNLTWTKMTAPISGRVGVRMVDVGNLVAANDATGIVSINQITPIAVLFTVPQGDFQRLAQVSDNFKKPLVTQAYSQESNQLLATGELVVVDNHVDSNTATVQLKARFPNADKKLWPGQFINVVLTLNTLQNALTMPNSAVNQGPNGPFAFVVGPNNKVTERPITLVTTQGLTAIIKSGLQAGDNVVTDGQLTLKAGSSVTLPGQTPPGGRGGRGGAGRGANQKKPAS